MDREADSVTTINGLLDFILLNVRVNAPKLQQYRTVPVPDLEKKLQVNLLLATLTASLTATQGTLSDLRTIRRVGDVTVTSRDNTLYVTAPISLDHLELLFHHYTLQVAMIKKSGDKLRLNIKKTYFNAFLVIRFEGLQCELVFEKFTMLEFNDIDVEITGFSFLNPIARRIAEWAVEFFNDFVVKEVAEEYTRNLLNLGLSDKNSLQRLFAYAINGMVLESSKSGSESRVPEGTLAKVSNDNLEDQPVAPLRQRRNTSTSASDRRSDPSSSSHPSAALPHQLTSSREVSRPNNIHNTQDRRSELNTVYMNGRPTASPRLPEGSLRNNLSGKRNEIIIQQNKLFSSKSSGVVNVSTVPVKPPML